MRILGKRSLSSVVKVFIDISYFVTILATVALTIAITLVYIWQPKSFTQDIPISFDLDSSVYHVSSSSWKFEAAHIVQAAGRLQVVGLNIRDTVSPVVFVLPALGVTLLVLNRLRAIFRTLRQGTPFVYENASRIRVIGLALIFGNLAWAGFMSWTAYSVSHHLTTAGISIRSGYDSSNVALLSGVLLIIIAEIFREGALMKRDMETAREIQFELVPAPYFEQGNICIQSYMRPANTVGGDYYDIIPLEARRIALALGDVSGKGMPAALLMSLLQGSLKALVSAGFRGGELIARLNTSLLRNTPESSMVTMFYGELDTDKGEMLYVNAGHNAPFLIRAGGGLERFPATGTVLGLLEGALFEARRLDLHAGDALLLFTDGIPEAFNAREEEFGEARLTARLRQTQLRDPRAFVESLVNEVVRFSRPAQPTDDMTLMLLTKNAEASSSRGSPAGTIGGN